MTVTTFPSPSRFSHFLSAALLLPTLPGKLLPQFKTSQLIPLLLSYVRWILYHKSPNYQLSKARTSPETGETGKRERKVRHIHELITSPHHDCTEDSCPSALVGHILERSISISLIYIFFLLGNRQTDRYIDIYIYIYMTCMDIIYIDIYLSIYSRRRNICLYLIYFIKYVNNNNNIII